MPNWCNNTTTLFHDNPKMLERVTAALEAEGLLQEFVPMPDDIGVSPVSSRNRHATNQDTYLPLLRPSPPTALQR